MTRAGNQRAQDTSPEKRIANALDRKAVDWLRDTCVLQFFVRLVELQCDPRELWDCFAAIAAAWQREEPQRPDAVLFPHVTRSMIRLVSTAAHLRQLSSDGGSVRMIWNACESIRFLAYFGTVPLPSAPER